MSSSGSGYLETAKDVYRTAALTPDVGLCCTTNPVWTLPGLRIPEIMKEMNYGCGSTVHARDLTRSPTMLYVGVGGGMELLQLSYFNRQKGGVIGVDVVQEMLDSSRKNFKEAEELNDWFKSDFVDLRMGDALALPLEDGSVDVAAQNCLFNIFKADELKTAIAEMYRVLRPRGRLVMSDPICEQPINDELRNDERLRALCLSGSLPLAEYCAMLTDAGFGTIEVRARKPYRILSPNHYATKECIYIESVEVAAIKTKVPEDGPCIFTGRTAIYFGNDAHLDDGKGHVMSRNQPMAVCDKTAAQLEALGRDDLFVSKSTFHYSGGGCC